MSLGGQPGNPIDNGKKDRKLTPEEQKELEAFYAEIALLVGERRPEFLAIIETLPQELSDKEKRTLAIEQMKITMGEFCYVENIKELTIDDARIWNLIKPGNYKKGSLLENEFQIYNTGVNNSGSESRMAFKGVIAQKITVIWDIESILDSLEDNPNPNEIQEDIAILQKCLEKSFPRGPFHDLIVATIKKYESPNE